MNQKVNTPKAIYFQVIKHFLLLNKFNLQQMLDVHRIIYEMNICHFEMYVKINHFSDNQVLSIIVSNWTKQ